MWRIFRLGIKSNICPGNQTHFRIIGTTSANADCDEKIETCTLDDTTFDYKENDPNDSTENLATRAANEHQNFLKCNALKQKLPPLPICYKNDRFKLIDDSLCKIQWREYSKQREKILANPEANNKKKKKKSSSIHPDHKELSEEAIALLRAKKNNENDQFGTLSQVTRKFDETPEDKDDEEHPANETLGEWMPPNHYGRKMLALCKEHKLEEALHILYVEMKLQNVYPNDYCYNVLISACGKAGYSKKAFTLYTQMKQRGLTVGKHAYTGLFNACANSPFKEEAIESARNLRKRMKDDEMPIHPITYHAMIKAFGHCGDISAAFEIVDEMLEKKVLVTTETMNFLLQACISDKKSGFRHALMVWRRMRSLKLTPCIYSYNLLLRCVKECEAGEEMLVSNLLEGLQREELLLQPPKMYKKANKENVSKQQQNSNVVDEVGSNPLSGEDRAPTSRVNRTDVGRKEVWQIPDGSNVVKVELGQDMELEIVSGVPSRLQNPMEEVLPDVLSRKMVQGKVESITSLTKKEDRFWLVGGVTGVLRNMMKDRVKPNHTTFNTLLDSLPSTIQAEENLMAAMKSCNVTPEVIFFNKLIRRRCFRSRLVEAKDVLDLMQDSKVLVDLVTFGCLALGCFKPSEMNCLLRDMQKAGFTPNEIIFNTLLKNCRKTEEFGQALELLQTMRKLDVNPNEMVLDTLEEMRSHIRQKIIKKEREEDLRPLLLYERRKREEMRLFLIEYKKWLKRSDVHLKDHPWAQFGYLDTGQEVAKTL